MMAAACLLNEEALTRFNRLVQERTGLSNNIHRQESFSRAIRESAVRAGLPDLEHYYSTLLRHPTESPLWEDLVRLLTIGETYFFRDPEQLQALRKHVLPELIARHWNDRTLRIWSAGCATGEEAYTLAMLLRQLLPDVDQWNVSILATDLNKKFLEQAGLAQYRSWSFRQPDPALYQAYFVRHGDVYQLSPAVQKMVTFAYLNLIEDTYPSAATQTTGLDLILCRNVTIYLPEPAIRKMAGRFYHCLNPESWLVLGPSESNDQIYHQFKPVRFHFAVAYKKTNCLTRPDYFSAEKDAGFSALQNVEPVSNWEKWRNSIAVHSEPPHSEGVKNQPDGLSLIKAGRFDEARQFFIKVLAEKPDDIEAHLAMGHIEANSGRLPEARRWVEQVIEMTPLNDQAHYLLAVILQEMNDLKQALASFKKVVYLKPDFVMAYIHLFLLLQKTGQCQDAARTRANALRLLENLAPGETLPGSDGLTVADALNILKL